MKRFLKLIGFFLIKTGRRFQASIPPLMKANEVDERKFEKREFLKWTPENVINEQQLEQYLQLAKAVSMFSKVVKNESTINNASTKKDETGNNQRLENKKDEKAEDKNELNSENALNKFKLVFKSLSQFVDAHHPLQGDSNCELINKNKNSSSNSKDKSDDELSYLPKSSWTEKECLLFAAALEICSKNFSSIKKEFLPFKSSKNIIDYYNLCLNQQDGSDKKDFKLSLNEEEIKKCNELRNKLDARSADGKDANLEQCFVYLNQFLNELMKQNVGGSKELNKKFQLDSKDNDSNDDNNSSNNSNNSSLNNNNNPTNSLSKNSKTNNSRTNSKNTKNNGETKEENNEKRNNKSLKQNNDTKRSSLRTSSSNKTNQSTTMIEPINQQTKTEEKTEQKDEYEFDDKTESDCNSLGSLKFFKDGQLVLKLNNKFIDNKTKWEESTDSIELNRLRKRFKKKKIEANRCKKQLEPNNKSMAKFLTNEDQDESSSGSETDSRTSSEHSLFNKKAKVKVENNYYLPLASTELKDEDLNLDLKSNSDISKLISSEDNLKRKPRSSKTGNSKKTKIHLNECTNNLNVDQLVDHVNLLSSLPLDLQKKLMETNLNPNNLLDFEKNQNVNNLNFLSNLTN